MKSIAKGFTLIELMIVVAIVGVLAAIALPVYQDYIARSQVSEGVAAAGAVKTGISEYYASLGEFPPANQFQDTVGGRYVANLTHAVTGVVTGTMRAVAPVNQRVRGFTFLLSPGCTTTSGGKAISTWICSTAGNVKYLPSGCQQGTGAGATGC